MQSDARILKQLDLVRKEMRYYKDRDIPGYDKTRMSGRIELLNRSVFLMKRNRHQGKLQVEYKTVRQLELLVRDLAHFNNERKEAVSEISSRETNIEKPLVQLSQMLN